MADVGVSLGIDAHELYQELQNVTARFVQFSSQTTQAGEKAGSGFAGGFKSNLGSLGTNITQALGAIGIGSQIKDVVEYGTKIQDLSDRFGVSTQSLQKFGNAAEKNGSSLEGVAKAFRFLEVNQSKALGGNEAMLNSFAALGISVEDLKSLTPDEIMLKIGTSSLNAADTVKTLGKSALEMRTTLAGLADGTIRFGGAIDDIDIKKLKEADDAFKTLHQTVTIALGSALGSFFAYFQASIVELVSRIYAAVEEIKGLGSAAERVAHGDFSGAKKAIDTSRTNADEYIKQGKIEADEIRHPEHDRRDFSHPADADTGAGETDDEGRATGKGAKSAARDADRDAEKVRKIERDQELEALPFEKRQQELHGQADFLKRGADSAETEAERNKLKLQYYDIVKQINEEEKKHAREIEQADRNLAREKKADVKEHRLEKDRPLTPAELNTEAQRRDLEDRRAHGTYAGSGADHPGLVSGHVQASSLIGDRSTDDFHADFSKHVDLGPQHLNIAERLKQSGQSLGKDSDKEKHLPVAEKQLTALEKIEKNTADMGKNKS